MKEEAEKNEWLNGKLKAPLQITTEMEIEFLKAQMENDGMIGKMAFYTGYPKKEIIINSKDLFKAILKDVEELERKKNENAMPIEAHENEVNETISRLLKTNKDYENTIDKLQEVIVAQAIQIVDLKKVNGQLTKKNGGNV